MHDVNEQMISKNVLGVSCATAAGTAAAIVAVRVVVKRRQKNMLRVVCAHENKSLTLYVILPYYFEIRRWCALSLFLHSFCFLLLSIFLNLNRYASRSRCICAIVCISFDFFSRSHLNSSATAHNYLMLFLLIFFFIFCLFYLFLLFGRSVGHTLQVCCI